LAVIPFDFDNPGSRDNWEIQNKILGILKRKEPGDVRLIISALYELTARYSVSGGEINIDVIAKELPQVALLSPSAIETELRLVNETLTDHLRKQIQKQKNAKRYIPDVFVEVSSIKDKTRYFAHPVLFIRKVIDSINCLNFDAANHFLRKFLFKPIYIELPTKMKQADNVN
jgi:hypothetical protein